MVTSNGVFGRRSMPAAPSEGEEPDNLGEGPNSSLESDNALLLSDLKFAWGRGEYVELDLSDTSRTLIYSGKLLRSAGTYLEPRYPTEVLVILLDNYLIFTKPKLSEKDVVYDVDIRPIPLELLSIVGLDSLGKWQRTRRSPSLDTSSTTSTAASATWTLRYIYPFSIERAGNNARYMLYAESLQGRDKWKQKLKEAIASRSRWALANRVFTLQALTPSAFKAPVPGRSAPFNGFPGKVLCSVSFTHQGVRYAAIGCEKGVWVGPTESPQLMRLVPLFLNSVTQCAVLEDYGIFLVLANKSLLAYRLSLILSVEPQLPVAQKLHSGSSEVQFFSVGNLNQRTVVIFLKKKEYSTKFEVLEPIPENIVAKSKVSNNGIFGRSEKSNWFRVYRTFSVGAGPYDVTFLKPWIAITSSRGFQLMDIEGLRSNIVPQRNNFQDPAIAAEFDACSPIGIFNSGVYEYLLCYDKFGLYLDPRRPYRPSDVRSAPLIKWEGRAERVAFYDPYVLLFTEFFIEVRHIERCNLVQIIRGSHVRCTWEGPKLSPSALIASTSSVARSIDAEIHVVQSEESAESYGDVSISQEVFQLIPLTFVDPDGLC